MSILSSITDKVKNTSTTIAGIFGIIATVGGAVLYVENNYANAGDVKTILNNQSIQMRQTQLFQLEYYDDRIRKLEQERNRNQEILADPKITPQTRAFTRKPEEINEEIREIKSRREIVKDSIISADRAAKR